MRLLTFVLIMSLSAHAFGQTNRSSSSEGDGVCVTDARWANGNRSLDYSRQLQQPISITLLTYLSKGNTCANTEIRVTATFLNEANESSAGAAKDRRGFGRCGLAKFTSDPG